MLVVVLVLENPDRFAIRLTEQISSIGLFAVTESQCTEDEHDDEDEDDSKFRSRVLAVGFLRRRWRGTFADHHLWSKHSAEYGVWGATDSGE